MTLNWRNSFLKKSNCDSFIPQNIALPGNFYWKNSQGHYVDCNQSLLELLLLKADEFIGKTDSELWPEQAAIIKEQDNQVLTNRLPTVEEQTFTFSARNDHTNYKIFLVTRMPWRDRNGVVIGTIGSLTDITQQKQKEADLRRENYRITSRFENILDAVPANLYWKDSTGVYLGCNSLMAKTAKLNSKVNIIGKTDKVLWPDAEGLVRENDRQVLETQKTINVQEILEGRTYLSSKAPLYDEEGEFLGIIGASIDITPLQTRETPQAALAFGQSTETASLMNMAGQTKAAFLENIRQDLRQPLSSILAISELLSQQLDRNEIKKYTLGLTDTSRELLRFLNETLESAHLSLEKMPLVKKPFDLRETLENVLKLNQLTALEKHLSLELKFDEALPGNLIGDPIRIYRIVLELLSNALKFTRRGYVTVTARLGKMESQEVVIQIFVEDSGPGISEEKQEELFLRFKQPTIVSQDQFKEDGLGLSLVKRFIDDINGEIYVDSHLNQGSKFVCVIPLKKPLLKEPFTTQTSSVTPLAPPPKNHLSHKISRKCVLVVEDYSIASLIAKTLFSERGFEVDIAENGATALSCIEHHQYNFILLDIGLPDIDGYEVARKIRAFEEITGRRRTFIVGLSCHTEDNKKQMALEAGMNIVLSKPLTQEIATSLLENFISPHPENNNKRTVEKLGS